jgi:tRNA A37 N6-isopentenylltransferase MiaA
MPPKKKWRILVIVRKANSSVLTDRVANQANSSLNHGLILYIEFKTRNFGTILAVVTFLGVK